MFRFARKLDPEQLFTRQEKIGRGSFGEVFKGIDNRTGQVGILFVHQISVYAFLCF
ncbi:unnamed protein product [Gongylonema pulchrum]|uniref:Protein kinase domain-containing protein n=1 Tax=Gongylonema pulchrum TaxID=637853 RepID=A0A183E1X0_9BILA|nr:unnamed protein product [Gongylonema pulchrum]